MFAMKTFQITSVSALLFVLLVSVADARTIVRTGETVSISQEQIVEGDLYTAAVEINISGDITEEILAAGSEVTINGNIESNAFILAGVADIYGSVGDDLRIISGDATIAEPIDGDVFFMGGTLKILSTASITGDVLVYAQAVTIEGAVGGDVLGNVTSLRIDADVAGDIDDIVVRQLTLGDRANIQGSVRYISSSVLEQALNATVAGELLRSDPVVPSAATDRYNWLIPTFVLLFSGLAWYLVSRNTLSLVTKRAVIRSPRPILIGTGVLILTPFAIIILITSFIGSLLSGVLFMAYGLVLLLGLIGVMPLIGKLLLVAFNQSPSQATLLSLVVGAAGFVLLSIIPGLGAILILGLLIMVVGAIVDLITRPNIS